VAQNVYKNKHLQGEFSDPDSPYYQGDGTGTDENGNPVGNCSEINAGCTASQEEIEDYIGDEIIIIGSSGESLYYYHPDHLGSASVITDGNGNLREHTEYFAFGETWVQEGASKKTPFMYTGKELDQETGLYYYGARYYDPRTSVWQSVDPILEKYLPSGDPEKDKNLPGMGGFFNSGNLAGYTYTHQNPVRYVDPDGNVAFIPLAMAALWVADKALAAYDTYQDGKAIASGEKSIGEVAKDRASEHVAGATLGILGRLGAKATKRLSMFADNLDNIKSIKGIDDSHVPGIKDTLNQIKEGEPFKHKQDGTKFGNREGLLSEGDYLEYTVETPGLSYRGKRRLVIDQNTGDTYYTSDHYKSFTKIEIE